MQYLETRRQVGELLAGLGHTSGEVARRLAASGVRGKPRDAHSCAIALYLNAILGPEARIRSVRVDRTTVRVVAGRPSLPMSIKLPEAVRTFVRAFDERLYPELVRGTVESERRARVQ